MSCSHHEGRGERNHDERQDHPGDSCLEMVTQKIRRTMNKLTTYIRIGHFFAVIFLFGLSACTGKQAKQSIKSIMVEKKWAKDCNKDSKIHILASNARFANGEKVLTNKQEYIKISEDFINDVEALVTKYLDKKDKDHYIDKRNNTLNFYFRQYLCYKENGYLFVFANLYAYRITRYDVNATTAFASNPNITVINPLKGNNKDYKILLVNLSEKSICSFMKK